mmetsp:Transcript_13323/g.20214  ORF Transcript_13323/g.20214 Transcript_13323/m.20214 type:complete len:90 (-) Transcript_13323:186-455(-)
MWRCPMLARQRQLCDAEKVEDGRQGMVWEDDDQLTNSNEEKEYTEHLFDHFEERPRIGMRQARAELCFSEGGDSQTRARKKDSASHQRS